MRTNDTQKITVEIQRLGEASRVLTLDVDATVQEALEAAQLPLDTLPTVGGVKAELNAFLDDGDILVFPTKGIVQGA